ncbi:hypothetical protein D3H55_07355 [Bacillus salacetis]|uniref:YtzH-like protein n=1 Tax=Bacillus salacetis TaxID=2315464 RepID=A0A3A1R1T6_9BACI|nr:YtzH-like family protein [Bacillus salacetis]RIW35739.1 hypothetical protein D3H55_07355 [Bacillus salacetis]
MPLGHQDQMNLLKDILTNHYDDCCGSVAECEQLERLVKSLMVNSQIGDGVKPILQEIYNYSQNGINSPNLDHHINSQKENLSQWVQDMDTLS